MKKVVNINLGGYPLTIDEDAYTVLDNYLLSISRHFSHSEGQDEIVSDIEARMAELFQEKARREPIVNLKRVNEVISIMGTPQDFGAEPIEPTHNRDKSYSGSRHSNYKTGKRLFRDPNDKVIAGVASGLAAYFGVEDPVWLRMGLVALVVLGAGFPIFIYLLMVFLVPEAKTPSDRLAMKGEPVNASNIGRIVEEELENFGEKMDKWGEKISKKFDSKKKR